MNLANLERLVSFYKENYCFIDRNERFKWEAIETFRENWNIEAEDFYLMLSSSLRVEGFEHKQVFKCIFSL